MGSRVIGELADGDILVVSVRVPSELREVELSGSDLAIPGVHIRSRVVIVIDTNLLGSLAGGIGEKVVVREDHHATLGGRKDSIGQVPSVGGHDAYPS